jgi:predicted HTH transcriptional regulator
MPIYTTPLSQLGPPDLQELLDGSAVENIRLEFKLLVPGKEDTLKKLSSFANTFGGFMVIGAKANSADGRVEDLPGVEWTKRLTTNRKSCSGASTERVRR